jgi:alpha-amylase
MFRSVVVLFAAVAIVAGALGSGARTAAAPARPARAVDARLTASSAPGVIVQMFDWPWTDIASECTSVLGPDGYAAVQISPPQEAVVLASDDYPWWQAYQPVSYNLNSRFGTEAQLASMISTCHAAGVKVYADVVPHHMTAEENGGVGDDGDTFPDEYDYPAVPYTSADFSPCETSITDWDDEYQVWNCQLDGLATLNTSLSYVQDEEADYLNSLIALGVDGFRWDSAKEMNPAYIADIEALLTKPVYVYQDVEWGAGQPVTPELYESTGSLMEYRYGWDLYDAFTGGTLASLSDFGPSYNSDGMVPSSDAVVFVDDQDTERDGGALYYTNGAQYTLANVFMLAWDYGTPEVLSDYAFSSYNQGPPSAGGNAIAAVTCGTGTWECEQRWPAIVGMVGWHNAAGNAAVQNWWSDGDDAIAFSRGSDAWVAINDESTAATRTFTTGLPAGTYCDVISGAAVDGACTGTVVAVNSSGQATVTVPADDAVAIDVSSVATAAIETVTVTVPSSTTGTVYLAGTLSSLGEGAADWAPAGISMTQLSSTKWTATITATADTTLSYKYDLDGSWSNVEETASCGYVANRSMSIDGGTQVDTVAAWDGVSSC